MSLINLIENEFKSDFYIKINNLNNLSEAFLIKTNHLTDEIPENLYYWDVFLKEEILINTIDSWYKLEDVFNYFLPAILIKIVKDQYIDSVHSLCVLDSFSPIYNYGFRSQSKKISHLRNMSSKQRSLISQFFEFYYHNNPDIKDTYEAVLFTNTLLDDIANLHQQLIEGCTFTNYDPYNPFKLECNCMSCQSFYLLIKNKTWLDLISEGNSVVKDINYSYVFFELKAALYYLPAYMILSLKFYFDDLDYVEFTIGLIFQIINTIKLSDACKVLSLKNLEMINEFMILISHMPYIQFSRNSKFMDALEWIKTQIVILQNNT